MSRIVDITAQKLRRILRNTTQCTLERCQIKHFLLELGKGFLFEARQKRFTFEDDDFFVDLVFYNRLLRCYVLIDLKIGKLTHQDLGQMQIQIQMYINYFDGYVKTETDRAAIGIVMSKKSTWRWCK